jgi:hypothetical protein
LPNERIVEIEKGLLTGNLVAAAAVMGEGGRGEEEEVVVVVVVVGVVVAVVVVMVVVVMAMVFLLGLAATSRCLKGSGLDGSVEFLGDCVYAWGCMCV